MIQTSPDEEFSFNGLYHSSVNRSYTAAKYLHKFCILEIESLYGNGTLLKMTDLTMKWIIYELRI